MKMAVVVDSTLDVSEDLRESITTVPLRINLCGRDMEDGERDLEWLFETMKKERCFAKTSQPSPERFKEVYEKLLRENDWVLSIHISSKLSGTVQSALLAKRDFGERVRIFDTLSSSIAGQIYVERALLMRGEKPDVVLKELEELRKRVRLFLTVRDLEFLKRSGRLSGIETIIGSVLRLKPIIEVVDGSLKVIKVTVGVNKTLNFMKEKMESSGLKNVVIGHILNPSLAQSLKEHAKALGMKYVVIPVRSMTLSAHLGPGGYGIALY